jgi:hypothetical protein
VGRETGRANEQRTPWWQQGKRARAEWSNGTRSIPHDLRAVAIGCLVSPRAAEQSDSKQSIYIHEQRARLVGRTRVEVVGCAGRAARPCIVARSGGRGQGDAQRHTAAVKLHVHHRWRHRGPRVHTVQPTTRDMKSKQTRGWGGESRVAYRARQTVKPDANGRFSGGKHVQQSATVFFTPSSLRTEYPSVGVVSR